MPFPRDGADEEEAGVAPNAETGGERKDANVLVAADAEEATFALLEPNGTDAEAAEAEVGAPNK